jgi:hypothetical protein
MVKRPELKEMLAFVIGPIHNVVRTSIKVLQPSGQRRMQYFMDYRCEDVGGIIGH